MKALVCATLCALGVGTWELGVSPTAVCAAAADDTGLWYTRPAPQWDHALPLGNGRLGAMVFGNVNRERIQLNIINPVS